EDRPLVDRQSSETSIELIVIEQPTRRVRRGKVEGRKLDFANVPAARPASFAIARIDEHPVQPGLEAVGVAKAVDVAPSGDERLLRRVLGRCLVVEAQSRDGQESTDRDARQLTERVMVAGHRPLHEIPHRASVLRHRSGRATAYESASWLSISDFYLRLRSSSPRRVVR